MSNKPMSRELNYDLDSVEERMSEVKKVIEQNDDKLVTYFDDYYNPSLAQSSRLSDNDPMCRQLERIADYLLHADNKEQRKLNHGEDLHIVSESDDKKNKKKESLTDDMTLVQDGQVIHQHKLYRGVKVNKSDREQYPELEDTGILIERLKKMIDTGVDSNGNTISEEAMRKIRWYLIEIRKDEVAIKEMLKGYIRFKRLSPEGSENDYSGFSFENVDHVRVLLDNYSELKQNSFDDTHGDLKIILEVFESIVDAIDFEEYIREIFIFKIDGLNRKKIVNSIKERHDIEISESRISQLTKNVIPEMIVESYKKKYQDWVYTFVKKGTYKTCTKCKTPKLTTNFGKEKRSKDGLRTICNSCRKK